MRTNKYDGDRKVVDHSSATPINIEEQDEMIDVIHAGLENGDPQCEQKQKEEEEKQAPNNITTLPKKSQEKGKNLNETNPEESNLSGEKGQDEGDEKQLERENVVTGYLKTFIFYTILRTQDRVAPVEIKEDYKTQNQGVHLSWNITAIFSNINNKYKFVLPFIIVLPVIASLALHLWNGTNISKNKATHMEKFNTSLNRMKNAFPGQTERFWKILRNRGNAYLKNPSPKRPLVIMIAASPSAHNVLDCMARKIAYSLEREDDVTNIINGANFKTYSDLDDAKKNLDENLDHHLQKSRTLIVLNLDLIPPQSPLLFYEYCDNENAPYKQAVIVFTIRLKVEPSPSLTPTKAEGLVEKHLKEIWRNHGYRPDDINPLVSRVTDTIVLVNQESEEVVKTNCAA